MTNPHIIIIGAGVAGLAAGCYAQMNGLRSRIFEMNYQPGGLCTSWTRNGYIFDGCLHYLFGSGDGGAFNELWRELGALDGREFIHHKELTRLRDEHGRELIVYADPARLEAHLCDLSPADGALAADLAAGVRDFMSFDMAALQAKPKALMSIWDWREVGDKLRPFVGPLARWGMTSAAEFGARFRDPFLRRAVPLMFGDWPEIPMMAGLSLLAYTHLGNAGFPVGGSLDFVRALERRYLELGGEITYSAPVERILVENGRAVGVRLYNDEEHRAGVVISAADGRATIFDMLDGEFVDRRFERTYDGRYQIHTQLQVSLGIDRDLTAEPHWVTHLLDEPRLIAGQEFREIAVKHFAFDPTLAPVEKTAVIVNLRTDYRYWQRIYGRRLYDTEQLQVAGQVIDFLETRHSGIGNQIEVKDVATPLSYERFTGNWQGATCGFLLTDKTTSLLLQGLPQTLPGLQNFYMCGQWVEPGGGVPQVAMSGRNAIQHVCAALGKEFKADS